jgi:ABC-type glycerol-3-phosphate transport system permease component
MHTALFFLLLLYALSLVYMLVWGLFTALKTPDDFRLNVLGIPEGAPWNWAFDNFAMVAKYLSIPAVKNGITVHVSFVQIIGNTLMYVIGSSLVAVFVPCAVAYVTARFPGKMSSLIYTVVIVTMVLTVVGAYPSEIQLLKTLRLYDTIYGIIIQRASFLSMYYLVFYAASKSLPNDFFEAAYVDGASEWKVMIRIMLPLVRNILFTVFLIKFIEFWNDYQFPLLYMPGRPTLSYGLYYISNSIINELNNTPGRMAGCIMILLPILILFSLFANKLMDNVAMGGIKE